MNVVPLFISRIHIAIFNVQSTITMNKKTFFSDTTLLILRRTNNLDCLGKIDAVVYMLVVNPAWGIDFHNSRMSDRESFGFSVDL